MSNTKNASGSTNTGNIHTEQSNSNIADTGRLRGEWDEETYNAAGTDRIRTKRSDSAAEASEAGQLNTGRSESTGRGSDTDKLRTSRSESAGKSSDTGRMRTKQSESEGKSSDTGRMRTKQSESEGKSSDTGRIRTKQSESAARSSDAGKPRSRQSKSQETGRLRTGRSGNTGSVLNTGRLYTEPGESTGRIYDRGSSSARRNSGEGSDGRKKEKKNDDISRSGKSAKPAKRKKSASKKKTRNAGNSPAGRKKKKPVIPVIISLAAVVMIIAVMALLFQKSSGNGNRMNKAAYYELEAENDVALIVDDQVLEEKGKLINGKTYIGYNTTWSYLNSGFFYEEESDQMIMTLPASTLAWTPNDGSGDVIKTDSGDIYISTDCIAANSDIELQVLEEPYRVVARTNWNVATGTITQDTEVRYKGGPKSEILTTVSEGDTVVFKEDLEDWICVSTSDGYVGYVRADSLSKDETTALSHTTDERFVFPKKMMDGRVCMAWTYTEMEGNYESMLELTENAVGLNVISPTWFKLGDENGELYSLATAEYVEAAHNRGYQVWGLFGDILSDSADTVTTMSAANRREYIIQQLINEAVSTGMDGINLDFENVGESGIKVYLQFARELSVAAHQNGLTVSIDNYVPSFTAYYQRDEQAKFADYIVIMGYDEYTSSSEEAGPVASLPFVENGIADTLKEVPASQVINAVPFYTRAWTQPFGSDTLTVESMGMDEADRFVEEHGITLSFDETIGEMTGSVNDTTARYSIWLENEQSLEGKLELIRKYQLAGFGAWRLGYERDSVWPLIQNYMNSY